VLYRGADFSIVWPEIVTTAVIGTVYSVLLCTVSAASFSAAERRGEAFCAFTIATDRDWVILRDTRMPPVDQYGSADIDLECRRSFSG
jgi:hypothetical protein